MSAQETSWGEVERNEEEGRGENVYLLSRGIHYGKRGPAARENNSLSQLSDLKSARGMHRNVLSALPKFTFVSIMQIVNASPAAR